MPFRASAGALHPGEEGWIRQTTCNSLQVAQDWARGVAGPAPCYVEDVIIGTVWRACFGEPWAIWQGE